MCTGCYKESKGLVKIDGHYVPWSYRHNSDLHKNKNTVIDTAGDPKYFEDINAGLPKITWCDRYGKWKVFFTGPDIGGYDVQDFVWYFDNKEDIINAMISGEET